MILGVSASGNLLDVVLIFKGQGTRVGDREKAVFANLKNVRVIWQAKAWIDAAGEAQVTKLMIKPYVREVNKQLGYEAEFLLTQDRGPGHDDESGLSLCLILQPSGRCSMLSSNYACIQR